MSALVVFVHLEQGLANSIHMRHVYFSREVTNVEHGSFQARTAIAKFDPQPSRRLAVQTLPVSGVGIQTDNTPNR